MRLRWRRLAKVNGSRWFYNEQNKRARLLPRCVSSVFSPSA